eukprot:5952764-Amphidinium_carterae.1
MSPESLVKVLHSCVSNGGLNMSDCLMDTINYGKELDEAPHIAWPMHHNYHPCWQQTRPLQGMVVDDAEPMLTPLQGATTMKSK